MSYRIETKFKKTEIGLIPEDWEIKELNKIGKIITGKTPPTKNKEYFGKLVPFITPRDMLNNKFIKNTERYLSKEGEILLKNIVLPENSICVSCIGSDMGKVAINKYESITNQQINSIISKNLNYNFVYYSLSWLKKELKNLAYHSTAIPILNKLQFSKIKICTPSIKREIDKISEILLSLDEKIELNNKINNSLEQISKTIFKHWFIDFEFPNEQGKPYKSSGGEFIDSELGKIPRGWGIIKFGDAINIFDSKRIPISSRERSKRKGAYPYYGATGILDYIDNYIFDGIYVLIGEDGSVIKENGKPFTQYVYGKFWVNNHAHIVQGKNNFLTEYIKLFLDHLNIYPYITGAVQLKLNQENLLNIKLISPLKKLLIFFDSIISTIFKKSIIITEQNRILSIIRGVLLPKLITGKIRINLEDIKES